MPPKGAEKPIFKDLVIALACPMGGQWTDTNISRWVGQRSGVFTTEMNDKVTHLICSPEDFKNKCPRVKQALKLGAKACDILTIDWLEDSINKKRRLPEKPYLFSTALKLERAKKRREEKVVKGLEQAERFVNPNLHHIYTDETFFRYEITLTRDEESGGNKGQRYVLYLFESNAKPHLYLFAAKFYKKHRDSQPNFYRPSTTHQSFSSEFNKFKAFFHKKTGIKWDERLIAPRPADKERFSYQPPTGGKPVGFVPKDLIPPDPEEAETQAVPCSSAYAPDTDEARMENDVSNLTTGKAALVEDSVEQVSPVASPHGGSLSTDGLAPESHQAMVVIDVDPTAPASAEGLNQCENTDGKEAALQQGIEVSTNANIQNSATSPGCSH